MGDKNLYYLIDLERSIVGGMTTYWKPNTRGYSTILEFAGLYSKESAEGIVRDDFDKRTVMVAKSTVERILKK